MDWKLVRAIFVAVLFIVSSGYACYSIILSDRESAKRYRKQEACLNKIIEENPQTEEWVARRKCRRS